MRYRPLAIVGGVVLGSAVSFLLISAIMSRETVEQGSDAALKIPEEAVFQASEIVLSVEGFRPRESIVLRVANAEQAGSTQVAELKADAKGNVEETPLLLPDWLSSGEHRLEAYGNSSKRIAARTLTVRATDLWISLDKYSFKWAEPLGFIAGGFVPKETAQVFLVPDKGLPPEKPVASFPTDSAGNSTWSEFTVPMMIPGSYSLVLRGDDESRKLSRTVTIEQLKPSFELSPWSGPPGSKFDVNAQGFIPGEQVDLFLAKDGEPIASLKADQYGNIWGGGPIVVPYSEKGGSLPVTLLATTIMTKTVQNFSVIPPKPWGELSVYSGYPGTAVQFGGGGFNAGEKVMIYLGGSTGPLVSTSVTDSQGNLLQGSYYVVQASEEEDISFYYLGEMSKAWTTAKFKVIPFPTFNRQSR